MKALLGRIRRNRGYVRVFECVAASVGCKTGSPLRAGKAPGCESVLINEVGTGIRRCFDHTSDVAHKVGGVLVGQLGKVDGAHQCAMVLAVVGKVIPPHLAGERVPAPPTTLLVQYPSVQSSMTSSGCAVDWNNMGRWLQG